MVLSRNLYRDISNKLKYFVTQINAKLIAAEPLQKHLKLRMIIKFFTEKKFATELVPIKI